MVLARLGLVPRSRFHVALIQIQPGDKVIEGVFHINGGGPTITLVTTAGEIEILRQEE